MSRRSLYMFFKECTERKLDDKIAFMEDRLRELTKCPQSELRTLKQDLRYFKSDLKKKWASSNYTEERFMKRNEDWLNTSISIHTWIPTSKAGRPCKDFRELSDRSKRRKTKDLRAQVPVDQLTYAASVSQRTSGNVDASKFINESSIFQSSLISLRLQACINEEKKILWQNPTPSSTRFCRPIRIRFLHETVDITKEEIIYVEDQAKNLTKTEVSTSKGVSKVNHILLPTMVDAKVCNSATSTASTMRCYICGKTSKGFNDFEKTNVEDPQTLRFGLSILHARIRLFETLIHLAYKLPLRKWQARTPEDKRIVKENKERIQKEYREKTGLIIDMPKPGFGNSNTGNTSRRFFNDPELAAEITGIQIDFIKRLRIILEAISSGHKINVDKFKEYTEATAKLYVELYGWHPMTPTLHKILIHGATVIKHAILPIGQLSEEAAEARNKHFRQYRLDYARKFCRIQCNKDVLNRLLLTSDPFSADTLELLEAEEPYDSRD